MRICYVGGMGTLGYPMAAWTAHVGFNTIIADVNARAVKACNDGSFHSPEPDADRYALDAMRNDNLWATMDVTAAVLAAGITFVIVQSPSRADGSFSIDYVLTACTDIGLALGQTDEYKVIAISTTVNPGDVEGPIRERLEELSGKKAHKDFGLVCCPEFVRRGCVIRDFSQPEYIIIGCDNVLEMCAMQYYYRKITLVDEMYPDPPHKSQFHVMSVPSAEIAKIGLNVAVTSKIARANEVAWLCHETPGADAADVLSAIGADSRIGPRFFSAGPPPGGPCFPRDNRSMAAAMRQRGLRGYVTEATAQHERWHTWQLAVLAMRYAPPVMPQIGVLGLAYKPGVDTDVGSVSLDLMDTLAGKRIDVWAYDPKITVEESMASLDELVERCDVLVLMTCWPEFKRLKEMELEGKTIIDVWGFLGELESGQYVRFGRGPGAKTSRTEGE